MKRIIVYTSVALALMLVFCSLAYGAKKPPHNGIHEEHYKSGQLKSETPYKNGKEHGKAIFYDKDGKITKKVDYHKGQFVDEYIVSDWDLGILNIFKKWWFYVGFAAMGGLVWFLFTKVAFRGRPT